MANLNRIILIGKLTADPEGRSTLDGLAMSKFRLAVDRPFGGTDLIDVVAWRKVAESASESLTKGQLVLVEGRIQIRTYEDQSGQRHWATEVIANSVRTVSSDKMAEHKESKPLMAEEEMIDEESLAGDLPF